MRREREREREVRTRVRTKEQGGKDGGVWRESERERGGRRENERRCLVGRSNRFLYSTQSQVRMRRRSSMELIIST